MKNSRLGQSLMQSIDGGKGGQPEKADQDADNAFDQAEANSASIQPEKEVQQDEPLIAEKEPQIAPAKSDKVLKIQAKKKKGSSALGGVAIVIALIAISVSGYAIYSQHTNSLITQDNLQSLEEVIGAANTRTDSNIVAIADLTNKVERLTEDTAAIEQIRSEISSIILSINVMKDELDELKRKQGDTQSVLTQNEKQFAEISKQIKKLGSRPAVPKTAKRSALPKKSRFSNTQLEGARVASIDLWGTQPSVMLQEPDGKWKPLSTGDFYKGWRLEGAFENEAVFKKGSKTRRLTIEE